MSKKQATIRDVAKAAEVSITTVSQILNGTGRYSEPTIKKVWDTVNFLGYTPNSYALKLFSGAPREHTPTNLLMRISYMQSDGMWDEELLRDIFWYFEKACMERGKFGTCYLYRHQLGFHNSLIVQDLVDGVVLGIPHKKIISMLEKRLPTVLTDVNMEVAEVNMPIVTCDQVKGYETVLRAVQEKVKDPGLLILRGLSPNYETLLYTPETISRGMVRAAKNCGMELPPDHFFDMEVNIDTNELRLREVMDKVAFLIKERGVRIIGLCSIWVPDLIIRLLREKGIDVPGDVILLTSASRPISIPGVAGIVNDWKGMNDCAVEVLCRKIAGKEPENKKYILPALPLDFDTNSILQNHIYK